MRNVILSAVAAIAIGAASAATLSYAANEPAPPPIGGPGMMEHHGMSPEVRAALFDARIAGMKAALKLTPDQEKTWAPFEAAVRSAAKDRMEAMKAMHERMQQGEHPTPIEHMTAMSDDLAKASADLKQVADAAKPLYDSLNDTQKRDFGPLMMQLRGPHERRPHGEHAEAGPEAE